MAAAKSTKSPAFQFYPADFLSDPNQIVMTAEEAGIYIRLMAHAWKHPLQNDMARLAKLAGVSIEVMSAAWIALSTCFEQRVSGEWIHPRLERERRKQRLHSKKQTENGLKGGRPVETMGDMLKTHSEPTQKPPKALHLHLQLHSVDKKQILARFDQFWSAYPKRVSKAQALKAWMTLSPDEALVGVMVAAIAAQRMSPGWLKEGGKFIPYPATWLNGRRWEDEATVATPAAASKPPVDAAEIERRRNMERYKDMPIPQPITEEERERSRAEVKARLAAGHRPTWLPPVKPENVAS